MSTRAPVLTEPPRSGPTSSAILNLCNLRNLWIVIP